MTKKAVKLAHLKKQNNLQEQVATLTTMVTGLSKQVEEFHDLKQWVDEYLEKDVDMDEIVQKCTDKYLSDNLEN